MSVTLKHKLPFPYFIINHQCEIISSSIEIPPSTAISKFTDFLETSVFEEFDAFIKHTSLDSKILLLELLPDKLQPYRVYKVDDANDATIHLYCYPIDTITNKEYVTVHSNTQISNEFHEREYSFNVEKLAAGIAHEIRNPLTAVKGFLQLLKPYLKEINKSDYAEIALDEINRANDIIYQFLNSTKPQGKQEQNWIHLNNVVKEMGLLYQSEAILNDITLEIKLSKENPRISINGSKLKQVLTNMMKNAVEAISNMNIGHHRKINVRTEVTDHTAFIIIEDNGEGMSEGTVDSLFSPFYTTKKNGTGLGLSVCKKIIEEHNGHIHVTSKVGSGTIFKIELPILTVNSNTQDH